jgi:two-component system LytT family sensor kinase
VLLHSFFWMTWVISFTVIQSLSFGLDQWLMWLVYYIITLPIFVVHTYLIAYWLIPETFFKGRYLLLVTGLILLLIIFSVAELVVSHELVFKRMSGGVMYNTGYLNFKEIIISGIGNHYVILVFLAIKTGISWYYAQNQKEELLQTQTETELEIYRFQLQPELIYTLVEELEQLTELYPEKASDMIVNISNFLNQFLFEGQEEMISLSLEAKLIEEFLDIHRMALKGRLNSNFIVSGNLNSYVVPPLLLLPFINNAIKIVYACNNSYESTVIIKAEKRYLLFTFTFWSENEFRLNDKHNLEMTKKRLNYRYPGKHRLVENIDENFKEVSLEIFY